MFYPPLSNSQMVQLIQLANINAAAMKVSLSQINDPEEQRRIRDEVDLLEDTARDLSEILEAAGDTPPVASTITPKVTVQQAQAVLDAIEGYVATLEGRKKANAKDDIKVWALDRKIGRLVKARNAINEELQTEAPQVSADSKEDCQA